MAVGIIIWALALMLARGQARAAEAFFRTNDVIAFVGGEDVVEMQRHGYLELLLTAALPGHHLRFRSLAFEGDTVFEQHRQLNFPSWEKQLERVGATVVVAQFGQSEALQETNRLGAFAMAYSKLLDRFTNGGRRLVLLAPTPIEPTGSMPLLAKRGTILRQFSEAAEVLAERRGVPYVFLIANPASPSPKTRDGFHLNASGHVLAARAVATALNVQPPAAVQYVHNVDAERLRQLIIEKNRLWFDYWRPQNWAFLNGDRTEQASSRDHRDPKKRWFPEEMEKFLPLIAAKEREIWKAAEDLR